MMENKRRNDKNIFSDSWRGGGILKQFSDREHFTCCDKWSERRDRRIRCGDYFEKLQWNNVNKYMRIRTCVSIWYLREFYSRRFPPYPMTRVRVYIRVSVLWCARNLLWTDYFHTDEAPANRTGHGCAAA